MSASSGTQVVSLYFNNYTKVFDCVDHHELWKILKEMGILDYHNLFPKKLVMWDKKQQLEPDMEQQTVSKLG